jgi:hypothetical protein
VNQAKNEPLPAQAPSSTAAENIGGKRGGWLEFLGFVDSSASTSAAPPGSASTQHPEPEPQLQPDVHGKQLDCTKADYDRADSKHASFIQTRIIPLVEAHALSLLKELRLSELVRCVGAISGTGGSSSHSDFQLGICLRRLHNCGELSALHLHVSKDFRASVCNFATAP